MTSSKIIDVLEQLLEFNPYIRPKANEILQHPIFDSIRQPKLEIPLKKKINIKIDTEHLTNEDFGKKNNEKCVIDKIKIDLVNELIAFKEIEKPKIVIV